MSERQELLASLSDAVVNMEEEATGELSRKALELGLDASEILFEGVLKGMALASERYESGEYFVPELLLCSDALYAGLEVLRPHLRKDASTSRGRVVIGVVQGDTHDIGKNIVRIMLEGAGFDVKDLGCNVPHTAFVDAAVEYRADIIGLSTLMTTSMDGMARVIDNLVERSLRDRFKVIIGGAPISLAYARKIGADGYARNAPGAIDLVKSLLASPVAAG
ncbi:MAG: cobalamin-binding protein [Chloroflexota bacterium]|nr:MAG: cobalamin-binding protein [Chloroflexota bacterium]